MEASMNGFDELGYEVFLDYLYKKTKEAGDDFQKTLAFETVAEEVRKDLVLCKPITKKPPINFIVRPTINGSEA